MSEIQNISEASLLDNIFEGRNKGYGAYELRTNSSKRTGLALIISSIFFIQQANNLKVYSFEPINQLYEVLNLNLFLYSHLGLFKSFKQTLNTNSLDRKSVV